MSGPHSALWHWASDTTSLGLDFLLHKMGRGEGLEPPPEGDGAELGAWEIPGHLSSAAESPQEKCPALSPLTVSRCQVAGRPGQPALPL